MAPSVWPSAAGRRLDLFRGYLTFASMTAACLAGVALVYTVALVPRPLAFGWLDMLGGAAIWTAMLLPQAWLAYWAALKLPFLRRYIVGLRPEATGTAP